MASFAVVAERTFASVSRVQARLLKLLEPALSARPFWIRAELSSVKVSNGRMYCDLVEMANGKISAKLRCTIWATDLEMIKRRLSRARLENLLEDGNEVGLLCQIQYHQLYGMSVTAADIDPNESLGALERKRQEIIAKLRADNLLGKNGEHSVPPLPHRVGLVASRNTAGYKDFVATIAASGYNIEIVAADARVEGDNTELSVLSALHALSQLDLDLVIVLRGGGSRVSLSYMDNEAIARHIAQYKYPVWTAIGHEIDTSVIDAVAHTSFKTPTAVAEHLVARYAQAAEKLRSHAALLQKYVTLRLQSARERINAAAPMFMSVSRRTIRERKHRNAASAQQFRLLAQRRLGSERGHLLHLSSTLHGLAKQRTSLAQRVLEEHKKSLGKTIGRTMTSRHQQRDRLRERLLAPTALNRIRSELQRCSSWRQVLRAADPARNLERGYALLYDETGALVRSVQEVSPGQAVVTVLADGRVASTVVSIAPKAVDSPGQSE